MGPPPRRRHQPSSARPLPGPLVTAHPEPLLSELCRPGALCTLESPKGDINHRVGYWSSAHICLIFTTLFGYRNHLHIDTIMLMPFDLTPLLIGCLLKMILNNRK